MLSPLALLSNASEAVGDWTQHRFGYMAIGVFCFAYLLVVAEDLVKLRKSKPVILASGLIWILVSLAHGKDVDVHERVAHHVSDFTELFLFLMVAMN